MKSVDTMLQYLIIQLDDVSASYCHYESGKKVKRLISLDKLKAGVLFAMKENLMIQFVYPSYELPEEYKEVIETIDHSDIVPSACEDRDLLRDAEVVVFDGWTEIEEYCFCKDSVLVLRTSKTDFFEKYQLLKDILAKVTRVSVVITDVEEFTEQDFEIYKKVLTSLSETIEQLYVEGFSPQLNLLTDRMMLDKMNNCNAGCENVTLAPDGRFYVCSAFYLASDEEEYGLGKGKYSIGDLQEGLDIKNPQLYKLSHAPLCRHCDAYQCKRCVWLNRKTTMEINTPSREQCVAAHIERNASRELLERIRKHGTFLPECEIMEIDYLDPFEVKKDW